MARSIPTHEPTKLVAGDSLQWDRVDLATDYPPASWELKYTLVGPAVLSFSADEVAGQYEVRLPAAETAALPAGGYRLRAHVTDGTDRFTHLPSGRPICDQVVTVEENPEQVSPGGTHAEKMLALIESRLEGRLTDDQAEQYTFDGVSLARISVETLDAMRKKYQREVYSQRSGGLKVRSMRVRF